MMKSIYRGYGLAEFRKEPLTKGKVLELYGKPEKIITHKDYSREMYYENLGLQFYYLFMDEKDKSLKDLDIIIHDIAFISPFTGKTDEGIVLNENVMADVFKIYGKENWITTLSSNYWWIEHSGISFYVDRDKEENPNNFQETNYLDRKIVRIRVPIDPRPDEMIKNEEGYILRTIDDFCIDGEPHQLIVDDMRAEVVCAKCGLVLSERMISLEYSGARAFSKAEREKRQTHGSPVNPLIPDLQMATMIDKRAPMPQNLRKAIKWDSRYTWKQRNMIQATSEIKRIGELLNLPNHVKVYAIKIYRQAFQKGLLKGRSIRAMVTASIYYACGAEQIPRTLQNVVDVSDATFHQVTKCYQSLIKELNLPSPTLKPGLLVSKYIAELNLSHQVEIMAQKILNRYEKVYSLSGKDPKGLVAAALYISAQYDNRKISQTKISRAVGITEVTLRNRLREMQKYIRKKNRKKRVKHQNNSE